MKQIAAFFDIDGTIYREGLITEMFKKMVRYLPFFYELGMLNVVPYPIHVIAPGCSVRDDGAGAYIANGNGTTFSANLLRKTILDEKTGYLSHPSVVSGPYMLTAYDSQNETATFTLNPLYKGNVDGAKLAIKDLTVIHSTGEEAVAQLASGEVGLVNRVVQADMIDALRQQVIEGKAAMSTYARSGYSFINFSCERDTVGEAAVRKAIALCFDKDAFIKDYVGDYGVRVDGSYGIGQWMYRVASKALNAEPDAPAENASAKEKADYQKELEAWEAISLEKIPVYRQDVQKAVKLLEDNGWNLNRSGSPFDSNKDDVRCKRIGNKLVALELSMLYPEENAIVDELEKTLAEPLKQAGVQLRIDRKPFGDVLKQYYRQEERVYDLIYLATNFSDIFDPSVAYDPADAKAGVANRSGIEDKKLYDLTLKMRSTEPGDLLTYCKYWVDFQMRFAEVLPVLPIYSNAYFDFASPNLQNYVAGNGTSWGEAIVGAYLSDVPTQNAEGTAGTDDLVFDN